MKENIKRITTGIVFMLVIVAILAINNAILDTVFVFLLSLCGMYEYNKCFKAKGHHPIPMVGYVSCLSILLLGTTMELETKINIVVIGILLALLYSFTYIVIKKLEVNIVDVAITAFSCIFVPFMFSFIKMLLLLPNGRIFMILSFASSISTDTMAYEIGSRFGKHKLTPISPKKSIEGSVAGIIGAMIATSVVALITNTYFNTDFNIILIAIMGLVLSVVGQIGDLAASSIKRYCGVKDYSKLLPGHGGILDRFDSILFIAPLMYVFIYVIRMI